MLLFRYIYLPECNHLKSDPTRHESNTQFSFSPESLVSRPHFITASLGECSQVIQPEGERTECLILVNDLSGNKGYLSDMDIFYINNIIQDGTEKFYKFKNAKLLGLFWTHSGPWVGGNLFFSLLVLPKEGRKNLLIFLSHPLDITLHSLTLSYSSICHLLNNRTPSVVI